jgi:hypothetical protein
MAAYSNNGTVQYGTGVLTIGSAAGGIGGTAYIAENISLTVQVGRIVRKSELGETNGQVLFPSDVNTFTATLQLASGTTAQPQPGWETTVSIRDTDGDGDRDSEIYILGETGVDYQNEAETKISATFYKKI